MRQSIVLSDLADLMTSIVHYDNLMTTLTQQASKTPYKEAAEAYMDFFIRQGLQGKHLSPKSYEYWRDYNLFVVKQTWGSTAGGWEGMGGSAMTDSYTVVIENYFTRGIAVYYNGRLAYMAKSDEKLERYRVENYKKLPSRDKCDQELSIIYKP